jgi:hypothetical protein
MTSNSHNRLTAASILKTLTEISEKLRADTHERIVILVGGSALALNGLRETTEDIDSISHFDEELSQAIHDVGASFGLSRNWFNNRSRAFAPEFLNQDKCAVVVDFPGLQVLSLSLEDIFVMKINAARDRDIADLITMWPHVSFESSTEVVKAFRRAYPNAEHDEFLQDWVDEIIQRSTRSS